MLRAHGICPKAFQVIKFTVLALEYVDNNVHVVNERPLLAALYVIRVFAAFFFYKIGYRICNGFHLNMRLGFAKNEEVGDGLVNFSKVERNDGFALFFLNGREDGLVNLTGARYAGNRFRAALKRCDYFLQMNIRVILLRNIFTAYFIKITQSLSSTVLRPHDAQILRFPVLDSTNNYAMQLAGADMPAHGLTIVAERQTAGRGQRGATWQDAPGESVLMSIVTVPELLLEQQFAFSAAVAVAIVNTVTSFLPEANVRIKWPNDIIVNDRKTGGILIENSIRGAQWLYAIVGIGLNVRQKSFPESLPFAGSLYQAGGGNLNVAEIIDALREAILNALPAAKNTAGILNRYNTLLYRKNERQTFRNVTGEWQATVLEAQHDGRLKLMPDNGETIAIAHGEAQWVW